MYFDKSWNKICNKHLGLHMYRYGRNNDWPCRQIETQNWVHLSLVLYQLSYMYMCNVSATFCVLGFWSAWFSWRGVDQKSLAWGDELFGGGDLTSVTVTFPKNKNYWRKSEEHKLTWSYFDQSQVRISELWAGITVWGVSGLLASHTLTVWSPVLKLKKR